MGRMAPIRSLLLILFMGCSMQCFLQTMPVESRVATMAKKTSSDSGDLVPPKRPGTAYMGWLNDNRATIVKKVGTNSVADVAKEAGKQWNALSAAKKKPYQMAYAKAKAVFDKEMAAFKAAGGVVQRKQKRVSKKAARDPNMPKRPLSGFLLFMADNRAKIVKSLPKDHKVTEVLKEGGAQWNKLAAAKKKPYETKAAKLKAEYVEKMEAYKASL
ncbi:unnamed protein product [Durusdinium trenchii]|uniref:HMG box domain-containing protein n=2 Tax=Durusdinium trenchii TaxID=1381693 RepID=A0ABP0IZ62_9DINO